MSQNRLRKYYINVCVRFLSDALSWDIQFWWREASLDLSRRHFVYFRAEQRRSSRPCRHRAEQFFRLDIAEKYIGL